MSGNVVDLMDALRKSISGDSPSAKAKNGNKRTAGQGELPLPISGEKTQSSLYF